MAKHGRGLICLTLTEARCRQLDLPLMVRDNKTPHGTAFTMSIEAAEGVTTGISAHDRARTVQAAVAKAAKPADIIQPGHIFPLMAQNGGVLVRAGHTEAGCDFAQMAGLEPAVGDLRDPQGRRHHGAAAGPDRVRRRAQAQDRHHPRPDPLSFREREAGRVRRRQGNRLRPRQLPPARLRGQDQRRSASGHDPGRDPRRCRDAGSRPRAGLGAGLPRLRQPPPQLHGRPGDGRHRQGARAASSCCCTARNPATTWSPT